MSLLSKHVSQLFDATKRAGDRASARSTLTLFALPVDVLRDINGACLDGESALVVACSASGFEATRRALRSALDDFERARFGGRPGFTVAEAELILQDYYPRFLSTRGRAGNLRGTSRSFL